MQAVIFDFGKVISLPPAEGVMAELAAIAGLPVATLDALVWKHRGEYDRGTVSGTEYYRGMLACVGVALEDEALETMVRLDLNSWKRLHPGTVRLMEDVKAAGYRLGVLSNMPHDFLAWARDSIPVFRLLDVGIFSCEVGSIKPEAAIYEALVAALACKSTELVFFDDMQVNVDEAVHQGMHGVLWQNPENARMVLQQAGITV
ncbi:MAG: HAD family phosphatase [Treponema sp.]|jgi:putative hydrolase of the HAD superfamily|nr:HAD family phosphatase [Treponema sp.]